MIIILRSYQPTLEDRFDKPSNAGRKPGFRVRRRNNDSPDIIAERQAVVDPTTTQESSSLSFNDPREKTKREYKLWLRKDLPKTISKCQGRCGKTITQNETLIVKTFGKTSWTDRKTGQQREKFGPMYVHFHEDCLKTVDDREYSPDESFPFDTIQVDPATKAVLKEQDVQFLESLGIH